MARDGYRIVLHPPQQSLAPSSSINLTSTVPILDYEKSLIPTTHPILSEGVTLNGVQAYQCNLLMIDFFKSEFERAGDTVAVKSLDPIETADPPARLIYEIANDLLAKLRTLSRAHTLRMLDNHNSFIIIIYLCDDASMLPEIQGKVRLKIGGHVSGEFTPLTHELWDEAKALPQEFTPHTWDSLLLDAQRLLPEVGPAIAVVNAAFESFIPWALNELQAIYPIAKPDLWQWIFERGDHYQEPSVDDRFDIILKMLTGKSLKDDPELWTSYRKLRKARNTFSHEGKPMIGIQEVTRGQAEQLIKAAKMIVEWVEGLLPSASQRPDIRNRYPARVLINKPYVRQEGIPFQLPANTICSSSDFIIANNFKVYQIVEIASLDPIEWLPSYEWAPLALSTCDPGFVLFIICRL
jgi:hypothetical protein